MLRIGIVGLPNAGKSTLFNALTRAGAQVASYPFTTIDPNVGVVEVPDERLKVIAGIIKPEKVTPATIEFVDIAGLVKGASRGEGLGNRFLAHIREVDAIAHVVRCFSNQDVPHVAGAPDPVRDIETVNLELILSDLETVEKRLERTSRMLKSGERGYREEMELLMRLKDALNAGKPARLVEVTGEEPGRLEGLFLLTMKPVIYVANIDEDEIGNAYDSSAVRAIRSYVQSLGEDAPVIPVSARVEAEVAELAESNPSEAREYLDMMGLAESGLNRLVKTAYKSLKLITFFTTKGIEARAWTVRQGATAPQAAGKVHSDMERGFIKAEVVSYEDLVRAGSMGAAREEGLVRTEGKEYVVQDGDIILFRFNV
ncbi:MAG TPA: redox-regulated ATPase YchF [Firmicutes bacterium]|nr:redox-regulated ATPase YchF [Bacillota bacterium]